jgi:hypothetical protein
LHATRRYARQEKNIYFGPVTVNGFREPVSLGGSLEKAILKRF